MEGSKSERDWTEDIGAKRGEEDETTLHDKDTNDEMALGRDG